MYLNRKKIRFLTVICLLVMLYFVSISVKYALQPAFVVFCDVGQGDAALVVSGSKQLVIDTGSNDSFLSCLERNIPFWDRQIETVIITHADYDHIGGLDDLLKSYQIQQLYFNQLDEEAEAVELLKQSLKQHQIQLRPAIQGSSLSLLSEKGDIYMDFVWPEVECVFWHENTNQNTETKQTQIEIQKNDCNYDRNQQSISGILVLGELSILFTGDIDEQVELAILSYLPLMDIDIIKVPHHGSKYSTTSVLIDSYKPEVAVVSVGENNSFGHPAPRVIDLFRSRNISLFRTDLDGDIKVSSENHKIIIKTDSK